MEKYKCENIQCKNEVDHFGFCDECSKKVEKENTRIIVCEKCGSTLIKELFETVENNKYIFTKECMYCIKEEE